MVCKIKGLPEFDVVIAIMGFIFVIAAFIAIALGVEYWRVIAAFGMAGLFWIIASIYHQKVCRRKENGK